jgi:hypothetical protein
VTSVHDELAERMRLIESWRDPDDHTAFDRCVDAFVAAGLLADADAEVWRARGRRIADPLRVEPWPSELRERARAVLDRLVSAGASGDERTRDPADAAVQAFEKLAIIDSREASAYHERLYPSEDHPYVTHGPEAIERTIPGSPTVIAGVLFAYAAVGPRTTRVVLRGRRPPPARDEYRDLLGVPLRLTDSLGTAYLEPSIGGSSAGHRVYVTALVAPPVPAEAEWIAVHVGDEYVQVPA